MKTITAYAIDFQPLGRREICPPDRSLLDCAQGMGTTIYGICGGRGTCKSCRIRVISGKVSAATADEISSLSAQELQQGWRLACQTYPLSDCRLYLPPESLTTIQRMQLEVKDLLLPHRGSPPLQTYILQLNADELSLAKRNSGYLLDTINLQSQKLFKKIDNRVLDAITGQAHSLPSELRAISRNGEIIAFQQLDCPLLGLAVDIGTTKIAGYLVDIDDGHTLAAKGIVNPQISYGEDIISRINNSVASPEKAKNIHTLVVQAVGELASELCKSINKTMQDIVEAVVVGNTVMHHLFIGLPVKQLAISPFIPAVKESMDIKARELGLDFPRGHMSTFCQISPPL